MSNVNYPQIVTLYMFIACLEDQKSLGVLLLISRVTVATTMFLSHILEYILYQMKACFIRIIKAYIKFHAGSFKG